MNNFVAGGIRMEADYGNPDIADGAADSDSLSDSESAEELEKARATLQENPGSYEAHLNLVRLLRTEDLVELRTVRHNLSKRFSLPAPVWIEWLEDEERLSSTPNELEKVIKTLFPPALSDYVSVETAIRCINIQERRLSRGEIDLASFRRWFDASFVHDDDSSRPLSVAAYVYPDGIMVWRAYRNVLKEFNAPMDDQAHALSRQLAFPLRGNVEERQSDLFDAALLQSPNVRHQIEVNEDDCSVLEAFEVRLQAAGSDPTNFSGQRDAALVSQFTAYAASEESRCYLASKTVWERCIAEAFLCPDVWTLYGEFVKRHSASASFERCEPYMRAVKNVPWCLPIWIKYVQVVSALEGDSFSSAIYDIIREVEPHVMQSEDVESAEQLSMLLITLCRGDKLRQCLPTLISFNVKGSRSWANVLAFAASLHADVISAAEAMEQIISMFPREALWWTRYARMVPNDCARAIFKRAVTAIDNAKQLETLTSAWLLFEAERTEPRDATHFVYAQCALTDCKKRILNSTPTGDGCASKLPTSSHKRPPPQLTRPSRKKQVLATAGGDSEFHKQAAIGPGLASEGGKNSRPSIQTTKKPDDSTVFEPRVIYVNNLDFCVTPEELEKVFSPVGKVFQVRMPRRRDGAAKGMAYVEFVDDAAADAALSLHKMKISGREAWVRRSKPPKPRPGLRSRHTGQIMQDNFEDGIGRATQGSQNSFLKGQKPRLHPRAILASGVETAAEFEREENPEERMSSDRTATDNRGVILGKKKEEGVSFGDVQLKQDDFRAFVIGKNRGNKSK